MEIIVCTSQREWDSWLMAAENHPFQQSWDWGAVLVAEGKTVERLAVVEAGKAVLLAQVAYQKLPFGCYAYAAAGPVATGYTVESIKYQVFELLCDFLKKKGCTFFRIEPQYLIHDTLYLIQKSLDLTPSTTSVLDLRKPFEELLATLPRNTRYSIRYAESKGVTVKQEKNFEIFWNLMQKTGLRNQLRLHEKRHYQLILEKSNCDQLTAYVDGAPIASALFWQCGTTLTYLFSALDYSYHELRATYLLQKHAFMLAQARGCTLYDFFGIAPRSKNQENNKSKNQNEYDYDRSHTYAGITKFKLGFGGSVVERPGTFDVILKPVHYWLYALMRKIRRLV